MLKTASLSQPNASAVSLEMRDDVARAIVTIFIAALVTGVSVTAHVVHPIFAVLTAFTLSATLANWMPGAAVITVIFAALFQNLFVSLVSPLLTSETDFNIIRGYSFVILSAAWSVAFLGYLIRMRGQNPTLDRIMNVTTFLFVFIFFYFLLGFVQNPLGAVIYLRSIASAFMMFHLCFIFFARFPLRLSHAFAMVSFLIILFGYVEFFFRDEWISWTNGQAFWDWSTTKQRAAGEWDKDAKERGIVLKGFVDSITVDLFNTPLLGDLKIRITRLLGPNIHAISFAYGVVFFLMFALFRGSFLTAALLLPILLFANAKGALIVLFLVMASWGLARLFGAKFAFGILSVILLVYIAVGIVVGLQIGDFHVLGFMGGVHNFLDNPLGHGIGAGGNLSTNFSTLDWSEYQALGRTPIAIESAVGVMLFQMGVAAIFYVAICIWIAWKTIGVASKTGQSIHLAASFSLLTVLVNGIFQEEALFSPPALGLILAFNGMILGAAIRTGALRSYDQTRPPVSPSA